MLEKVEGIVLNQIKYGDSSLILHLYTKEHGRMGLMIPGARSRSKKRMSHLYQPLTFLEMEVYFKGNRDLQKAKEIRSSLPFESIPFHPVKTTVALFLADILNKALKEEESNPDLFDYLTSSIQYFDLAASGYANFHLYFMINLSRHLGFYPHDNRDEEGMFFDLETGSFSVSEPLHGSFLQPPSAKILHQFLALPISELSLISMNRQSRNELLEGLIRYYHLHLDGLQEIKSHEILQTLFE